MEDKGKIKSIQFYCLSIGVSNLLAAISYIIFYLNISYRWYIASVIFGTCSLTIAVFTFGCVIERVCCKKRRIIRPSVSNGQTGEDLETLDPVNTNVHPALQESDENYVEFFCFMKVDQMIGRSLHDETCVAHEKNMQQSNSSQDKHAISSTHCKDLEFYRKLTVTNNTQVNSQFTFSNRRHSFSCSVKYISEQGTPRKTLKHYESPASICIPGSMQEPKSTSQVYATVTKDNNPNVSPIRLKSSDQLQSVEQVQDVPELPSVHEKWSVHPTRLDIPDNPFQDQEHSELPGLDKNKKGSQSSVIIHDRLSSLNENFCPILGRDCEEPSLQSQVISQNGIYIERACLKADAVFDSISSPATMMLTSSPYSVVEPSYLVPYSSSTFEDSHYEDSVVLESSGIVQCVVQM